MDAVFGLGWSLAPKVPGPALAAAVGGVSGALGRVRQPAQLRANVRQVVGPDVPADELESLVRRGMQSYARYWQEALRLPAWDRDDIAERTTMSGFEHLRDNIGQGRGVVLTLTHSGNWDAAAVPIIDLVPARMTVVVERLAPESLYERFKRYREALRMEVVPLTGGPSANAVINQRLRGGGVVCLLADRDLSGKGISVELCGRRATMPPGPALAAIQTGAALIPLELGFTPTGWSMVAHPELSIPVEGRLRERVGVVTQELATAFTGFFRRNPVDWHMFQRVWPDVGPLPRG